jgi:hypothetical protein
VDSYIDVPVEIQARVEANLFFDALRAGDYAGAARAQDNLRALGWHVSREPARTSKRHRQTTAAPTPDAGRQQDGDR